MQAGRLWAQRAVEDIDDLRIPLEKGLYGDGRSSLNHDAADAVAALTPKIISSCESRSAHGVLAGGVASGHAQGAC